MGNAAGVRRNFEELEQRRMEAARLLEAGINQSEVARRLGVHRQSVIRWQRALSRAGRAGLKQAGRAGRKPKLSTAQLASLERTLKTGAEVSGYATGLWTLARVGKLIEQQYGVRYNPSQVWRILRQLNWSCQRPSGRALERNEQAIRHWKRVEWPRIKKKPIAKGV
jgi:transposase